MNCNGRVNEGDARNVDSDTSADCHDERLGHDAGEPLTKTENRENKEDPALHKSGGKGFAIGNNTAGTVETDDGVGELMVRNGILASVRIRHQVTKDTETAG